MLIITAFAITQAKTLNTDEWWAKMLNTFCPKNELDLFIYSLKKDGLYINDILKLHSKLKQTKIK